MQNLPYVSWGQRVAKVYSAFLSNKEETKMEWQNFSQLEVENNNYLVVFQSSVQNNCVL